MKKIILATLLTASATTAIIANNDVTEKAEPKAQNTFMDRIHTKGDLRLRYESIQRDDTDSKYRNRYRLRIGAQIDLIENLQFEVGMRSGFGNPTSGNQTLHTDEPLSDYFFQSMRVNIMGLKYKYGNSTFKIGRQPYMMYRPIKSQLVWDNDVSMNGLNYQYKDDSKIITLGANRPTLEEASVAKDDINLFLAQYVQKISLKKDIKLNLGTGIYYYDGIKGNTTLFGKSKGNTIVNGAYVNDYHIIEGFTELQFKDVLGKPLKIAAGVVYNIAADKNNFGYDLSLQLGKAKKVGDWQVKYSYTYLEDDATLGAYSDSDNFGGGTAAKGHAIRAKYKMNTNLYLAGNFFFDTLNASKSKTGIEANYDRVQLDLIIKF